MKRIIIFLLIINTEILFASSGETKSDDHYLLNVIYSPISYVSFGGKVSDADKDYGLIDQFSELPVKQIGFEILREQKNTFYGSYFNVTHNRVHNDLVLKDDQDEKSGNSSIVSISLGFLFIEPMNKISDKISDNLFLKIALGASNIIIWKNEVKDRGRSTGLDISMGVRYLISSNINIGVDCRYSESFLLNSADNYSRLSMTGIFPYVGIMW